jgi:hypothetical protein
MRWTPMTLHMIKLCVGAESIEDLARWQGGRLAMQLAQGVKRPRLFHTTFQSPKRQAELLDGGSIYWVIKGIIQARQKFLGFDEGTKEDGKPCCLLILDGALTPVRPTPRRPFQGWRYLTAEDAPADIDARNGRDEVSEMPHAMRKQLAGLGLL